MPTLLKNVTKITCRITSEELIVEHDGTSTSHDLSKGVYFNLDRKSNAWELTIEENKEVDVSDPSKCTELNTRMTDSNIQFSHLDGAYNPDPLLKFIGIEDIRDGAKSNQWHYSFRKSKVSLKTNKSQDVLVIRKAHL